MRNRGFYSGTLKGTYDPNVEAPTVVIPVLEPMDAPLSPAAPAHYGAVKRVLSPEDSFSKRADGSRRSLVAHSLLHRQRDSEADRIPETESVRVRWAIRASLVINVVRKREYPGCCFACTQCV